MQFHWAWFSKNAIPLSDQQQFRLNKINEIKDYLVAEIKKRELMSIICIVIVIVAPIGMESANFSLSFSISTGIIKKLLKTTRNKKKKHNKIVILTRSKLNSIDSKISEALIDNEISHENFMTIIDEEKNN